MGHTTRRSGPAARSRSSCRSESERRADPTAFVDSEVPRRSLTHLRGARVPWDKEVEDKMSERRMEIRPRFSRGQESLRDTPEKHARPNFARGQASATTDQPHMGEFATGQERQVHHPERERQGRFGRGQERLEA
jgi:hypothetical protein